MPKKSPTEWAGETFLDTGFRIHDAGWALIAIGAALVAVGVYLIATLT